LLPAEFTESLSARASTGLRTHHLDYVITDRCSAITTPSSVLYIDDPRILDRNQMYRIQKLIE
jgi:hypothetical protein